MTDGMLSFAWAASGDPSASQGAAKRRIGPIVWSGNCATAPKTARRVIIDAATRIPDSSSREVAITAIERDFADNEDDFGRKLYLIENCLYGVDIQPIAIQISKLRFFISLICDQRTNRSKKENHGVRPLPNLETKFVAANTLIGLESERQLGFDLFENPAIKRVEGELQRVRHDYFAATTRQRKLALQARDHELRTNWRRILLNLGSEPNKSVAA